MAERVQFSDISTPIGMFRITYLGASVRVVDLLENGVPQTGLPNGAVRRGPPFPAASPPRQLREYFQGTRKEFDLEVEPDTASVFDRAVWKELREVPAGYTVTYGELAKRVGYSGAARAVGGAMRRNPIPIVIPCHRVVGQGERSPVSASGSGGSDGFSTTKELGPYARGRRKGRGPTVSERWTR